VVCKSWVTIIQIVYNLPVVILYSPSHYSASKLTATSALPSSHIYRTVEILQPFCLFSSKMGAKVHC